MSVDKWLMIILLLIVLSLLLKKLLVGLTINILKHKGYNQEFINKHLERYWLK